MTDITEQVIDAAADVASEVSEQAEVMEKAIRSLNRTKLAYASLGALFGATTSALITFRIVYRRAETKYAEIADDEIAEMRQHYQEKVIALEAQNAKEDLEDIVAERGYRVADESPPMAIAPPTEVVEANKEETKDERPPASEVVRKETEVRNIFRDHSVEYEWDYHEERRRRSPDEPYVIHYDERHEFEGYSDITLTYYEGDDVLCNERDEIIAPENRDDMVGEGNLERFGHGSNDPNVVYIRNDSLQLIIEVVKSPNSYAEEVHGLKHTGYGGNLERMRSRERDLDDG